MELFGNFDENSEIFSQKTMLSYSQLDPLEQTSVIFFLILAFSWMKMQFKNAVCEMVVILFTIPATTLLILIDNYKVILFDLINCVYSPKINNQPARQHSLVKCTTEGNEQWDQSYEANNCAVNCVRKPIRGMQFLFKLVPVGCNHRCEAKWIWCWIIQISVCDVRINHANLLKLVWWLNVQGNFKIRNNFVVGMC